MTENPKDQDHSRTILCAVLDGGEIALVRVLGRGNVANAPSLKQFGSRVLGLPKVNQRFLVDLLECEAMDSTFMGVLAGICIALTQKGGGRMLLVNVNEHCRRLVKNLGLIHLLEIRNGESPEVLRGEDQLAPAATEQMDKVQQICLTLQAHRHLISLDEQNQIRFQAVIEYLEKNLEEEGGACAQS